MTIQELGSLGEFLAAIATIATLIYLAIQIKQNTNATRYETTRSLVMANSEASMAVSCDGELADILDRGVLDRDALTSVDQMRFNLFFFSYYNQVDFAYERYLAGELDENSWRKIDHEIGLFIGLPGLKQWWAQDKIRFSEAFVEHVEDRLANLDENLVAPSVPIQSQGKGKKQPDKAMNSDD